MYFPPELSDYPTWEGPGPWAPERAPTGMQGVQEALRGRWKKTWKMVSLLCPCHWRLTVGVNSLDNLLGPSLISR